MSPPAAAFNSPSGAGWTPARTAFPAPAQGHRAQPLGQLLAEPPQGRRARAGDGLRQQLKGSRFPHHRARAAAGVPAALRQHVAAAASPVSVIGLPSSDELGDRCGLRGRGQRRAGSPLRSGAECGSRLKALPAGPGLAPARCGSKFPGARARHRPRRGVGCQFESSVFPSLCSTFFSRVSPMRTPLYSAAS